MLMRIHPNHLRQSPKRPPRYAKQALLCLARTFPSCADIWSHQRLWSVEGEQTGAMGVSDNKDMVCWPAWCEHLEERLDYVINLLEQQVVVKLFMQSLRRLHSLDVVSLAAVYM